jgi:NADPH:quinone reductase-like Zn-dependent oxidoreductase
VIVVSSSDAKLQRAAALGADCGINRLEHPDWHLEVLEHTGGLGADLVLESVGGESLARSVQAAAYGGTVFMIGLLDAGDVRTNLTAITF